MLMPLNVSVIVLATSEVSVGLIVAVTAMDSEPLQTLSVKEASIRPSLLLAVHAMERQVLVSNVHRRVAPDTVAAASSRPDWIAAHTSVPASG